MAYEIKDWDKNFEISASRRYKENKWLPLPNKMDGLSYKRISMHKNKHEIFSCWILLIQLASKMDTRGVLENERGALDFDDMELITGFPAKSFKLAIEFLQSPKIGWIVNNEQAESELGECSEQATTTLHYTTLQNTTEHDTTEKKLDFEKFPFLKDSNFKSELKEYLKGRKKPTERAYELLLGKLHKVDLPTAILMIQQSIENGWKGIFEIKQDNQNKGQYLTSAEKQSNTLKELQKGWKENERIIESGQGIIESVESERLAPPNFD